MMQVGRMRGLPDRPDALRVLMYHKVTAAEPNSIMVHPRAFEEQQVYLAENYSVVSLEQVDRFFYEGDSLPSRAVLLTFDDGYLDNVTTAYPILKRLNHSGVVFVPTALVGGKTLPHDRHLKTRNPTASWDDLAATQDVFEFGSHGRSHEPLARLSPSAATDEVVRSREELEQRLGAAVRAFAYPEGSIGDFLPEHEDAIRSAGYRLAFTTLAGGNTRATNPFRMRRHNVEDYGQAYFRGLVDGSADLLGLKDTWVGYRLKRWVRRALEGTSSRP